MSGDLISRAKLRRSLMIWADKLRTAGECGGCEVELLQAVVKMVDAQAAVDAEPVQHGTWIYDPNAADWCIGGYVCSKCYAKNNNLPCNEVKNPLMFRGSNFCPHCGTKMYGGTDDERS